VFLNYIKKYSFCFDFDRFFKPNHIYRITYDKEFSVSKIKDLVSIHGKYSANPFLIWRKRLNYTHRKSNFGTGDPSKDAADTSM